MVSTTALGSRWSCRIVRRATLEKVWGNFAAAGTRFGWPERVLTDNGTVFGDRFQANLAALGVAIRHSRPYHPQTCGKVERFHQTLKQWLTARPPAPTITELQTICDRFIDHYNHRRTHTSIGRRTPHHVWSTTPKSGPADQPLLLEDTTMRALHHTRVYDGIVWARPYRITIGAAHNGRHATIITTGHHCHVFIDGHLVRELTIDPTRQHQPLHDRPGHPTT